MKEIAWNVIHLQAEEVANLCAGDQDRDAVGEADDDRPREVFYHGAHTSYAPQHQENSCHHRAHEQAVDTVLSDDSRNHYDERARWAADLRF